MTDVWVTGYAVLGFAVVAAATAVRTAAGRTPPCAPPVPLVRTADIAYLNGGPGLATLSALAALRADGLVHDRDGGSVEATGRVSAVREPLQRAVHAAAADGPVRVSALPAHRAVAAELDVIAGRLVAIGLLDDPELPRAARRAWWAPAAVALSGAARTVAELADGRFVAGLALLSVLVAVAAAALARPPRPRPRSRAADAELARLRRRYAHRAAPRLAGRRTGSADAAMDVALHGEAALRPVEPGFATAVPAPARRHIPSGGGR